MGRLKTIQTRKKIGNSLIPNPPTFEPSKYLQGITFIDI